ncbi:hypothetical protein GTP45_20310 [Pseudoduganella sp. FT55W]|uniref:Uncharacterized protein n=1 Tax=Duganella rivi TaxID=2666083 RepID=A0A7X4GT29_9BURK|nr:hypothetical protein [Duganella rivi]MYM69163.1 hypothetical protein [Duganella rivi]
MKIEMKAISDSFEPLSLKVKKNGDGGDFGALLNVPQAKQSDAASELEKYLKMSPEERTAIAMRKQLGISEDEYAAMTPEQKKAVDAKVAELLKQKMDEQIAKQQQEANGLKSGISL